MMLCGSETKSCRPIDSLIDGVKGRSDISMIGPAVTQLLKVGTLKDIECQLQHLSISKKRFIILCVSNSLDLTNADSGSHWSLLAWDRQSEKAYHWDSVKGLYRSATPFRT